MPRYIDADALMDELNTEWYSDAEKRMQGVGDVISICGMNRAFAVMRLFDAPTADVVEVVHGRWEITDAYPHWMCCSVCHKAVVRNIEVIERYEIPTSFCPNCGAKMEDT